MEEQSAQEGHGAVAPQLTPLHLWEMAEGARFENPYGTKTIGPDRTSSFRSQSLTGESEAGEEPVNRSDTIVLPQFSHRDFTSRTDAVALLRFEISRFYPEPHTRGSHTTLWRSRSEVE